MCCQAHLLPALSGSNAPSSTGGVTPLRLPAVTLRGSLHIVQDGSAFFPRAFGLVRRVVLFSNGTIMVFVVDVEKRPLDPCHPARARRLLDQGKAAVWRRYPFTLMLKRAVPDAQPHPLRVKLDPGSRVSGLAVVNDATGQVVWAGELTHRGQQVHAALLARRALRRGRRQRNTRYRPARFANRRRPAGWLPPSLESRVSNLLTWVARLRRFAPIGALSQ